MQTETPLPPPQAKQPPGTITQKQRKWIYAGVIVLAFALLISSMHSAAPAVTKQDVKRTPLGQLQEPAKQQQPPPQKQWTQQPPAVQPAAPAYYQPQQPRQTEQDQLAVDRAKREYDSAYADSVVKKPADEKNTPNAPNSASTVTQTAQSPGPSAVHHLMLPEGTVINGTLENRLNGDFVGPVKVMISTDVYTPDNVLVIPQGAIAMGEAQKVSGLGQQRLAVAFHRMLWPGHSLSLDKVPVLDQAGEVGLHDKVNSHYASIFGASLALGAIGGIAQIGNSAGYGYDPGTSFRSGVSESMAQSADRVLDRFLNRQPSIQIRQGTRIDIMLTGDLEIPAE